MKIRLYKSIMTVAIFLLATTLQVSAQRALQIPGQSPFSLKLSADIGLINSLSTKSEIGGLSTKANSGDYALEFGWRFWQRKGNSLQANIGIGYSPLSLKLTLPSVDYNYSAPASADIDGVPYIRYYELKDLTQKVGTGSILIPLYLRYAYSFNKIVALTADLGFNFRLTTYSKLNSSSGISYSYGIYPQYDNLLINAPYMNDFGATDLSTSNREDVRHNSFSASFMVGIGAEFNIWGPLSADLGFRYNAGLCNIFKKAVQLKSIYSAENAPVTYTVKEGQRIKPLSDYLSSSHLSQFSLNIGLIYRF